ncbi:MAG: FadR/GntR family transcriptional regulator, partial [Sphaerochaetaceae bacterium]
MRENIFSQQWLPGDKIPSENELSQIFNASRVSIRGAIQKLIAQGFLESKQGEGTFVRTLTIEHAFGSLMTLISLSKRNILQVLQYRKMIEVGIAEMIIDN